VLLLLLLCFGPLCRETRAKEIPMTMQPVRILAFGDSLTAGWGVKPPSNVPACLEAALQKQGIAVSFINKGIPGDTTAGGLKRFEGALACNPDLVILELGANDNLQAIAPDRTEANLNAMLQILFDKGIPTLLAGIRPLRDLGPEYHVRFQSLFSNLADRHGAAFYADYLEGVAGNPEFLQKDGLHPNYEGTMEIARRLLPLVTDMVLNIQAAKAANLQP
jgi:acyl-CoA thioesterase-1